MKQLKLRKIIRQSIRRILFLGLCFLFIPSLKSQSKSENKERAPYYRHSIGIGGGNFNYLTYKAFFFEETAVELELGSFILNREGAYFSVSFETHQKTKYKNLHSYFGAGFTQSLLEGRGTFGLKFPVGVEFIELKNRFNLHTEINPVVIHGYNSFGFASFAERDLMFAITLTIGLRLILFK